MGRVHHLPGLYLPLFGEGRRTVAPARAHSLGSWDRRLLQYFGKQHHEPGERASGSPVRRHYLGDDSRRLSTGTGGDLAGGYEERLHGFVVHGNRDVSVGVQKYFEAMAGNISG